MTQQRDEWRVVQWEDKAEIYCRDELIASAANWPEAAQIVREHNAFAVLVDALTLLKNFVTDCEDMLPMPTQGLRALEAARAALAAARGDGG